MQSTASIRAAVIEHLELLSDPTAQCEYARRVPSADVSAELVCGWFDDTYHPEWAGFSSAFTALELDALARFTRAFELILAAFDGSLPHLPEFHASVQSEQLVAAAGSALESLTNVARRPTSR